MGIIGILGSLGVVGGGHNRHIRLIRHDRVVGIIGILGSLGMIGGVGIIGIIGSLGMVGGGWQVVVCWWADVWGLLACLLRLWGVCGRWGRNSVQFVHFFWCWGWGGCIFAEDKLRLGIDCK